MKTDRVSSAYLRLPVSDECSDALSEPRSEQAEVERTTLPNLNIGSRTGYPISGRLSRCNTISQMLRQWREAVPETQGAMVDAAQATHGDDSAGGGASLTGPQDNCVTEVHATVRSRDRRQGRPLENRAVRTTDASAWPGCSRSVASEGRRMHTPARGDLPLTTQTYASWNLEGYCRLISHGGIPPRSRGGGGQKTDRHPRSFLNREYGEVELSRRPRRDCS